MDSVVEQEVTNMVQTLPGWARHKDWRPEHAPTNLPAKHKIEDPNAALRP